MGRHVIEYEGDKNKIYSTNGKGETFSEILARRLNRRGLVKGAAATGALVLTAKGLTGTAAQDATPAATPEASPVASPVASPEATPAASGLAFEAIALDEGANHIVANGYTAEALLKWGDPLFADAPEFDPAAQTAASQERQFGYNSDWVGFLPSADGLRTRQTTACLVVNHEYTNPELMFPGYLTSNPAYVRRHRRTNESDEPEFIANPTQELVDVELAAHGLTVVEVQRDAAGQSGRSCATASTTAASPRTTPIEVYRPGRGQRLAEDERRPDRPDRHRHPQQLRRRHHPLGHGGLRRRELPAVLRQPGTAGRGRPGRHRRRPLRHRRRRPPSASGRTSTPASTCPRSRTKPFRFGWAVEFDPYDPTSTPKKRTALGRAKHEGAHLGRRPRRPGRDLLRRRRAVRVRPTSSSPLGPTTRTTGQPTWTCSTKARSTSPSSTTMARASGCR